MENEAEEQQPRPQERNNRRQAPSYNDIRQNIRTIKTAVRIIRLASNPAVIWALVGIFIAIVIYMLFFSGAGALPGGGGSSSSQQTPTTGTGSPKTPPIPGLTLTLTGRPDAVDNGTNIEYTVSVSYDKTTATIPIENITVYLDIPVNSTLVRAPGNNTQSGNTISWPLSDTQNQSSFTFVLNPTANDITLPVKVYAKTTGGSGNPATTNNCGGKYALDNPVGNFGDPICDYTEDKLYESLKQQDPAYADVWFYLARCESSRNPNTYLAASTSGLGAYGLFQMNPAGHGSTQYDAGSVEWTLQISNAIGHNRINSNKFEYWERNPVCQWWSLL